MNLLLWIVFGLITGASAKFIMPSEQHGGVILAVVLGIVGAVVGGFISTHMLGFGEVTEFDLRSLVIAVGGALLVLLVYGVVSRRRP
jgi:uncharacterized membrane protein YeaQ/YmgE (transglycosylase-associated protein family)